MRWTRRARRVAGWMVVGGLAALAALFVALIAAPGARAQQMAVDLELVLGVDCSYSVNSGEFELQMQGLAQAFLDSKVLGAIQGGPRGVIAVTLVQWSSWKSQVVVMPWTLVYDAPSAAAVATAIATSPRMTSDGATSISAMIEMGVALFGANQIAGDRRVIDISSDGHYNSGRPLPLLKVFAEMHQVTINGLAIIDEQPQLDAYFERHIITGPGAFVVTANDYRAYGEAITRKLLREISKPVS